jgi:acyl-CoA-binding protein
MEMTDWQQYAQSIVLGFIFSFLLAKLFSVIVSFREENIRITRADHVEEEDESDDETKSESSRSEAEEALLAEANRSDNRSDYSDSDDDWEGVESTELDEAFSAATAFVAATAADRSSAKVSNDVQLMLYGLYKIATEGACTTPQPSALKMTARAKWQAWKKLGAMPAEEAMQKYIAIITEIYPTWLDGFATKKKDGEGSSIQSTDNRGPMGPVFSTYVYEEESADDLKMDVIHDFAREGEAENLLKCIEKGVPVDLKDSEGRTPLHWAVDRGHLNIAELLVTQNADVNAKDNEGQTPLHYAAVCERESIAEFLVNQKADKDMKDNDGNSAKDLCESHWPCLLNSTPTSI